MHAERPTPASASESARTPAQREVTLTQTQESALAQEPLASAPRSQPLPRGATLGRYVVLEYLGAGGMGVVYSAYDFGLDRKVSLKLVRSDRRNTGERQARLLREAQAMARLSHPNVVTIHDVGTFEDQVFIAMEFMGGGTLKQWLRERPRPWREVLDVFLHAGRGLAAAHRAGLVHRDFKPDNVLLGEDKRVRVTDFGLAVHASDIGDSASSQEPTELLPPALPPTASGTAAYMAPEQRRGLSPDPRADQYSFCVAFYEGLFGARPPQTADTAAPPPTSPGVPRRLGRILQRGLAPEPADRFATMDALLEQLARSRHPTRRSLAAAGALTLTGALGALVVLTSPARPEGEPAAPRCEASLAPPMDANTHTFEFVLPPPRSCPVPAPAAAEASQTLRLEAPVVLPPHPAAVPVSEPEQPVQAQASSAAPRPPAHTEIPWSPRRAPSSALGRSWTDDARSLVDRFRQESPGPHPISRVLAALVERLALALDGSEPQTDGALALAAAEQSAINPGLPVTAARPQTGGLLPSTRSSPSSTSDASRASGHDIPAVAVRPALDALERALAEKLAAHRDPAEIAQARFALAQALWDSQQDPQRALILARQAEDDLASEGENGLALKSKVSLWLIDKVERRHSNSGSINGL